MIAVAAALAASFSGQTPLKAVVLDMPASAREPQVAVWSRIAPVDPGGSDPTNVILKANTYVVCGTPDSVLVSISRDKAESFAAAKPIAKVGTLALGMRRGPRIAVLGESVIVTAIASEAAGARDADLLCWRSTDEGTSWSEAHRVNEAAGAAREGLHAMASGPASDLFCAWIDLAQGSPRICGSASLDAGATWSPTRVVFGDSARICPCCHPSVAIDGTGRVHVMWRGVQDGARDMWIAQSEDHGATFSAPTKIGQGTWKLDACPMDGGGLASALGRTMTVWRRDAEIFQAEASGTEVSLGRGEQPAIALGAGGFCAVWVTKRGGALQFGWTGRSAPIQIADGASEPAIASSRLDHAPLVAVWETGSGEATRIVAARLDRVQALGR
ncbi:MAG TPA: sialidase family protein [Planctomycetota bacterium]|nr:sialidase family protein [Planctomycetota bacterium]